MSERLRLQVHNATRAKQLLENELLKEAFSALRDGLRNTWEHATALEIREDAYWQIRGLGILERNLKKLVTEGELAERELARHAEEAAQAQRMADAAERRRAFNVS